MQTIAIVNQKGGVGKSTTAVNLGVGLSRQSKKVLLVDTDSQADLTEMLGWQQPDELFPILATVMEKVIADKPISLQEGILHHKEGVDLMPSNIELSGLEISLVNAMSRETVMRTYLNEVKRNYDYILIDCSPSINHCSQFQSSSLCFILHKGGSKQFHSATGDFRERKSGYP